MTGTLLLLIGSLVAQTPKPAEPRQIQLEIGGTVFSSSGSTSGSRVKTTLDGPPATWYIYTGKTRCEGHTTTRTPPASAGYGWRVVLTPSTDTNDVNVKWQRLWNENKTLTGSDAVTGSTQVLAGSKATLDRLDGGSRAANDPLVLSYQAQIANHEQTLRRLTMGEHKGPSNPRVLQVSADIEATRNKLQARIQSILDYSRAQQQSLPPVDGCNALSLNLEISLAPTTPRTQGKIYEQELWLVHRDPSGKETSQLQVVRGRTGGLNFSGMSSSFYFDDIVVATERGPVTVEIYGTVYPVGVEDDGRVRTSLSASRRYSTTSPSYSWKTQTGGVEHNTPITPGEVVSFPLPPLTSDEGALVGHRFSLRLRTKLVQ
jgi:hypothetical protein